MDRKIARINWNRGKYSDVFRAAIIDPSPLKQGQKVTVMLGRTKREYSGVIDCYPVEEKDKEETPLPASRARAKRKLVSVFLLELVYNQSVVV